LPITGLAEASVRPANFIGIHFFSPVDKMPLVEIIVGKQTGETAIARALDYVQQIRKTPIVVNDSRGFYTSRVFGTYVKEGVAMLAEGVKPALIENAAKMAGMPVGTAGGLGRGHARSFLQDHEADPQGSRRGLPAEHPADAVIIALPRRTEAPRQALRRRLLRLSGGWQASASGRGWRKSTRPHPNSPMSKR
jgi:3-hydroxyacyl-CoA dehydrogenase / enoyl-CoA hydratase / 3-hydroxybutyryl-CoA epimerase